MSALTQWAGRVPAPTRSIRLTFGGQRSRSNADAPPGRVATNNIEWRRGQKVSNREHSGWTASERVAAAVARHATSHDVPDHHYRDSSDSDDEVTHFAGAGADFARDTYPEYPPGALSTRHGNSPTLRHLLAAATRNPGRVELGGHVIGPPGDDERIVADRVYLFTDAPTPADAWRQAQDDYGILGATAPPDDIRLVDVPWRAGENAWLLAWE